MHPLSSWRRLTAVALACLLPSLAFAENEIVLENQLPGSPSSEWEVSGAGDSSIQGFATDVSVDQGGTIGFKIATDASSYRIDIYRLGWYGGLGARKVATVLPSAALPQTQPACLSDPATGLVDCGNWAPSADWTVPADAVSGLYIARLVRTDPEDGRASHVAFVVRDDDGGAALLFQTSETTWQAYNTWGGNSLYEGAATSPPVARAHKVSFNRPYATRGGPLEDWLFNSEYPMIRWLEANGYDVSYTTDLDSDRRGAELLEHEAFLSVGHDEYWSAAQRANVTAARDAGVDLAFFSGNEIYWKIRWEESIDGSATPHRTMVCYKEGTLGERSCGGKCDPLSDVWTGLWRDGCSFSPPADGCDPENALSGQISWMGTSGAITVPGAFAPLRLWRDTEVAALPPGGGLTLSANTLGYEWDFEQYPQVYPAGRVHLSETQMDGRTHRLSLYRDGAALVFGAGTVQWSWGLDGTHDRGASTPDPRMQQMTANLLAEMGALPETPQPGLTPPVAIGDVSAPVSSLQFPLPGANLQQNAPVTVSGVASDAGGGIVTAVEVSVDGGATWARATGGAAWSFVWTPTTIGTFELRTRAVDDLANLEVPGGGVSVTVEPAPPAPCPCNLFAASPVGVPSGDAGAVELGFKFRTDVAGEVSGVRFYKYAANTGEHTGRLWAADGTLLATVTFTGETASGWQEATFVPPVAVDSGVTYLATVHMPNGNYAFSEYFFASSGVDAPPLHALQDGVDGPNGVYRYGAGGVLPTDTYHAGHYAVDVVFDTPGGPDVTPPSVTGITPGAGAVGVAVSAEVTAGFSEAIDPATLDGTTFELRGPGDVAVPATVSYLPAARLAVLDPGAALAYSTAYTATLRGGVADPRIKDPAGNALELDFSWSFTTAAAPPPPPDEGPGGPILIIARSGDAFGRYYAEILRTEGWNAFTVTDLGLVTPAVLAAHDVALLAPGVLDAGQVDMLSDWVTGGGNLIAMRPDPALAGLLGLSPAGGTLGDAYLAVDGTSGPGTGIVTATMQYHGPADRWTLDGAEAIATLHSDAVTPTAHPAVTRHAVGPNGGEVACFAYDLARSVVYTRQGNPGWAGQERDGIAPIRSDDLFYGAAAGDPQPDWIDLTKVAIPQADEQMRLLSNLVLSMNDDRRPLPRLWYLPRGLKAAVVMTGDNHGSAGMQPRFDRYIAQSPPGCSPGDWECVRASGYLYVGPPYTDGQAQAYEALGFETALHVNTGCADWTPASLGANYDTQLADFATAYPGVPAPVTHRTHCIAWSDWATQPKVEAARGIRLDTNYYYWPSAWVQDRPGLFTGSALPMRFADLDGTIIDCYQVATQMTDESGQNLPLHAATLLDRATGPEGTYGVFCANMHFDQASHPGSDAIVAAAQARGVAVVSARQMLEWLDGRNGSSFQGIAWDGQALSFTMAVGAGARNLRAMLPVTSAGGELVALTRAGQPLPWSTETIKGVHYAFFAAEAGDYVATYQTDDDAPVIRDIAVAPEASGTRATVTWTTDEPADSRVDYGTDPGALGLTATDAAPVTEHRVTLEGLTGATLYHFRVSSADAAANAATEPAPPALPLSFATPTSPCAADATLADFTGGDTAGGTYVAREDDGEVILAPAAGSEFEGALPPADWPAAPWQSGGAVSVATGGALVDGALFGPPDAFGPGAVLECVATFGLESFQHIGFSDDFNSTWLMFSTGSTTGTLYARTNPGVDTPLPGDWIGAPHRYRIEWGPSTIVYSIDGTVVATQPHTIGGPLRAVISDFAPGALAARVDWLRVLPQAATGSYTSRVFDAGGPVAWGAASWGSTLPAGTSLAMLARTGSTPIPDASWSPFTPIAANGSLLAQSGRYLQYRADLATQDPLLTPVLADVAFACGPILDNAPPVISDLEATPAPAGTSAAIRWVTDEPADSRVEYGLAPDVLSSLVTSPVFEADHLLTLPDLVPGTTYYYRVVSRDPFGNAASEPAPPLAPRAFTTAGTTPAPVCATDDLREEFALGTLAGTWLARTADGELILAPFTGAEFEEVPPGAEWQAYDWTSGGTAGIVGGTLTVDGMRYNSEPESGYGAGRWLEFVATFGAVPFQHVGFGGGGDLAPGEMYNTSPWAMFSTGSGGSALLARCWSGGPFLDFPVPGSWLGSPHRYRIDWKADAVEFRIDGALVHTEPVAIAGPMRPGISDYNTGGGAVAVDWIRMGPYAASGTYSSRIFDAGTVVAWSTADWTASTPSGTQLALEARYGNTPFPDGTWSPFTPLPAPGTALNGAGRYLQYRAELLTIDTGASPVLEDVRFTCDVATPVQLAAFRITSESDGVRLLLDLGAPAHGATATFWRGVRAERDGRVAIARDVPLVSTRVEHLDATAEPARTYWYWVTLRSADGGEQEVGPVAASSAAAPRLTFARPVRPNPVSDRAQFEYEVGLDAARQGAVEVAIDIYDLAGRQVRQVARGMRPAGRYREVWDGRSGDGRPLGAGIYYYAVRIGSYEQRGKLTMLR